MASHQELFFDWKSLATSVDEKYKTVSSSNIRLASEIGIRLLERCKNLEESVSRHQDKIAEQTLEIEYLEKHSAALREINNSRLKIYEELEVGIVELEQKNHNLIFENNSNKLQMQSQNLEIQKFDTICFDLNEEIISLQKELFAEKRKIELLKERNTADKTCDSNFLDKSDLDLNKSSSKSFNKSKSPDVNHINISIQTSPTDSEDFLKIMIELDRTKTELKSEKNKVFELEDQIFSIIQENQNLQARFTQETINEKVKSVQQEFSLLEDVREGAMCSRCLTLINEHIDFEEYPSIGEIEMYDNDSLLESIDEEQSIEILPKTSTPLKQSSYNDLVEKYEALIKVHRPSTRKTKTSNSDSKKVYRSKENNLTNISEADTSSGFSEPTTSEDGSDDIRSQERFLCTLEDGDDCKINIYDASKINCSRFRNMPDYREIYKEIFAIFEKSNKVMLSKNINKTSNIKKHLKNIMQAKQTDSSASEKSINSKDNKNKTKNKSLNKKNNIKKSEESSSSSSSSPSSSSLPREEEVSKTTTTLQENNSVVYSKSEENDPYEFILVTKKNRKNNRNLEKSDKIPVSTKPSSNGNKDKQRNVNYLPEINKINNKTNIKTRDSISNTSGRSSNNLSSNNLNLKNHDLKMTSTKFKPSTLSKDLSKLKQLEVSYANILRAH